MKFEDTSVYNIYNAILGARNPKNSWDKSDSIFKGFNGKIENTEIGENDLKLAQSLIRAGSEHRKFMRQIFISVDITAPLYWWKEFDTYKVGTVSDSTSTMHKLADTPITKERFEMDDFDNFDCDFIRRGNVFDYFQIENVRFDNETIWEEFCVILEFLRQKYLETKDKRYWKELIRLLPESWLQKRTVTMSYENVFYMYNQRCVHPHKLTEWSKTFKEWVETLPYAKELLCIPLEKK
jgi:hypothetical protein